LLDLIDVNDPTGQFHRASDAELNAFRDALRQELGMPVQRRYSGGQDIQGACGMLAATSHGSGLLSSPVLSIEALDQHRK
jgi:23S rRNA (adenine2503-C2)-methyltransferase